MGIITRAFRNLSRRKIRAALVVIALGFCMAILIAVPPGIAANQKATNNLTGNLGNTITQTEATINQTLTEIQCTLTPTAPSGFGFSSSGSGTVVSGGGPVGGSGPVVQKIGTLGGGALGGGSYSPMNETDYNDLANITDVAAVEPMLQVVEGHNETVYPTTIINGVQQKGTSQGMNVTVPNYIIMGVPLSSSLIDNYPILPTNITAGRNLEPGDTYDVLLSENNSAYFNAGVGDTINILGTNFTVVGIYSPSGVDNQDLYMPLSEAQAITNNNDTVTQINVFASSESDVSSVANAISAAHPELDVSTAQDRLSALQQEESVYNSQLASAKATMSQTQSQAIAEIVIAVAATSVIVLFVMLYTVRERTKEIGTLKALGANNITVMGQFLLEGILLSVLAGVVGVAIGTIAAPKLSSILLPAVGNALGLPAAANSGATITRVTIGSASSTPAISVSPELMLIGFGVAVLLGAIGSLYPAWRAARTRPAEAMRYE
jgi:putative ABC transport system permease protein